MNIVFTCDINVYQLKIRIKKQFLEEENFMIGSKQTLEL